MTTKNLLVELFVEELPPKSLKSLGEAFAHGIFNQLAKQHLVAAETAADIEIFASPRRLGVRIPGVLAQAAPRQEQKKLMPVAVALDAAGAPTPALLKKLAALGIDADVVPQLKRALDGKAETLFLDQTLPGATLTEGLQAALSEAIAKLPIAKVMSYQLADGWSDVKFVRPAHRLVALHGADIVPVSALGLQSGRTTQGHRFEAAAATLEIRDADSYAAQLANEGAVIPAFAARRADIAQQLQAAADQLCLRAIDDEALLDEVTALVERPNVLVCQFDEAFLAVPQECLILTMKVNQKYFPLLDASAENAGKLTNKFLVVSNIRPADASAVIQGNERVVRPRLADAKFFFETDKKTPLAQRLPKLDKIVYHNKLGSLGARVERLTQLAVGIAQRLHANVEAARTAAQLAKADLVTDMVGEFPELQGIMGRYYAQAEGLAPEVADAIEGHYHPRFNGDTLPQGNVACAVALAERLDALLGFFGIGQIPTGDKDPFALRRAALGVLRILMETPLPLDLDELIATADAGFAPGVLTEPNRRLASADFLRERLRHLLREQGHETSAIEAVLALQPTRIDLVPAKLAAVKTFAALPEAEALAAANKRIVNLLKKAEGEPGRVDVALLQEAAEKALFAELTALTPQVESRLENADYEAALRLLAGLRGAVDAFFDGVMVMVEEPLERANRLALLAQLAGLMNRVADLSKL